VGLDDDGLSQIAKGLIHKRVARGDYVFRQGEDADSAFFVQHGVLDVVSALPGGGEVHLARSGPGDMLGETSLVTSGVRTASVRAETDIIGFAMERRFFQGAVAQANPAAVLILRRLIRIVSERLRVQYAQMVSVELGGNSLVSCRQVSDLVPAIGATDRKCSFLLREYLPRLRFFSDFTPEELCEFEARTRSVELPRGAMLFERNQAPESSFFVVRGALELFIVQGDRHVPLAILGPGALLGTNEIICGGARVACGRVREDAAILEIGAAELQYLISSESWFAIKFQQALCESLIVDLGRINKRIARLTSRASLKMG